MTLNANNVPRTGGKSAPPIDPGTYPSRLAQVIDLGLQPQSYQGEEKPPKNEILTTYELTDEFMKDEEGNDIEDQPRWIGETFALNSLNSDKAKSTIRYYALDPNAKYDGDWSKLIETPASVTIVQNEGKGKNKGKTFNNIAGVATMRARDAQNLPDLKNPPKYFDMDNPDLDVFNSLPDWVKDKIKGALNFEGSKLEALLGKGGKAKVKEAIPDDEIPFDDNGSNSGNW